MSVADYAVRTKKNPLNVRAGPGRQHRIVGRLPNDTRVTVKDSKAPWKQLESGNWVHGDYLKPPDSGPNTGSVIVHLRGIIPKTVRYLDNQEIPLPTTMIEHVHPRSKITVYPWNNANTYIVLISHPSWSGDTQALVQGATGGIITGGVKAAAGQTLSWASVKALGLAAVKALSVVTGFVVGTLAPVKGGTARKVLELQSGGLTVQYVVSK